MFYNARTEKTDILNDWKNRPCVLATMHHKEKVIAPLLQRELGISVTVPPNFNTDQFGTFTRNIARVGNQLEAARKKARSAMEQTGFDVGVASEGSFGSHPSLPFLASNLEIIVLIDNRYDIEVVGHYRTSKIQAQGQMVYTPEEATAVARSWGFPDQGVIVRLSEKSNRHIYKDIITIDNLEAVSKQLLSQWFVTRIFLETDMRAHRCPGRMESIERATLDLITNCQSVCPTCATPGYVITNTVTGLLCSQCHLPTDVVKETIHSCRKCSHQEHKPITDRTFAEPRDCPWCNP